MFRLKWVFDYGYFVKEVVFNFESWLVVIICDVKSEVKWLKDKLELFFNILGKRIIEVIND